MRAGTPEAMQEYAQRFPIEAQKFQTEQRTIARTDREQQLKEALDRISFIEKIAPRAVDEQSYQEVKQVLQAGGVDVSKFPTGFDPTWAKQQMNQVMGFKGKLEMEHREWEKGLKEKGAAETKRHNIATEAIQDKAAQVKTEKTTEPERTASGYLQRMQESEKLMAAVSAGQKPGILESTAATLPGVGKMLSNVARSPERQQYRQAQEDWVRAKLRKESGAVIADEEMDREIRVYFPQIGDGDDVIAQKERARKVAMNAMRTSAGRAMAEAPVPERTIKRTGIYNNRKVVEYDDGTVEYAD